MRANNIERLHAHELISTLDELGIGPGWEIADKVRDEYESLLPPKGPCLPPPTHEPRQGFQNQIVGRLAEVVFREDHLSTLEDDRFEIEDLHEKGENRDYVIHKDNLELPINVKIASTRFENALKTVGLDPDDCIPIGAYKAISASSRAPDLLYIDLVDFALRDKVDTYTNNLRGSLAIGWQLLSWYGGKGAKTAEDRYVDALFAQHAAQLRALAPSVASYHVISASRVLAILRREPRRVPGLGIPNQGKGKFGEANVHISVSGEMRPWMDVAHQLKHVGIASILREIRRTACFTLPDPLL